MDDLYFDAIHADNFLNLLMGGMSRAQKRFEDKLRTVDENGNPINETPEITSEE